MPNMRFTVHAAALLVIGVIVNLSLTIALLIKPFSESYAWRLACCTADGLWGYMQRHWERDLNAVSCLTITGDGLPSEESAIVISNHLGYADYYLVQAVASRQGILGRCRYFAKKALVYQIPIFGWSLWAVGMILVSRNWTSDKSKIAHAFQRVKANKHACWIVLYPEGTRRSSKKILESQAFARKLGKPELNHVLYPRTKGFVSTVQELRGSHVQHVYDLTFRYTGPDGKVPSLVDILSCGDLTRGGFKFHIDVKRTAIAQLSNDDEGLATWLEEAWQRKDSLLTGFK